MHASPMTSEGSLIVVEESDTETDLGTMSIIGDPDEYYSETESVCSC